MSRNKKIKFVKCWEWWEDNILDKSRDKKYNYFLNDLWFNSLPKDLKDIILKIDDSSWKDKHYDYYLDLLEIEINSYLREYEYLNYDDEGVQYLFEFYRYSENYDVYEKMSRNKEIKFVKWWEENILDKYSDEKYNLFFYDGWFNSLPTNLKDIILKIDNSSWEDEDYEYYLEDLEFEIKSYLDEHIHGNYYSKRIQYLFDFSNFSEYDESEKNINKIYKNKLIDFSNCECSTKEYNTILMRKIGIVYNDEKYLLKFMERNEYNNYKNLKYYKEPYLNSVYSEYICCHIGKMIGLNIQDTLLGYDQVYNQNKEIEYITCVACKDFCENLETLISFKSILEITYQKENKFYNILDSYNENKFYDILEVIDKQSFIDKQQLKEWFLDMFVFDSFIGNLDRNLKNFGIIRNGTDDTYRIAPIFDCASSLHSKASRKRIKFLADSYKKNSKLVYEYILTRNSYFKDNNGKRINYFDFLVNNNFDYNKDIAKSIIKIFPKLIELNNNHTIYNMLKKLDGLITPETIEVITKEFDVKVNEMLIPSLNFAKELLNL